MAFQEALTARLNLHPAHVVPMAGHECQTSVNTLSVSLNAKTRGSNIKHYCKSDDFRARFKVAKWRVFCHPARFKSIAARIKKV
jgi:hypothetical protein